MENLFGEDGVANVRNSRNKSGYFSSNPCIAVYGPGPEGTKCKTCDYLIKKSYSKTYFKCGLRKMSNGPSTDHRKYFPSCGKYLQNKI